jgi:hypothetical protein
MKRRIVKAIDLEHMNLFRDIFIENALGHGENYRFVCWLLRSRN